MLPEDIKRMQFLVTDDYESMRILIADHLKQLGVERILFAKSGNEAIDIITSKLGTEGQVEFLLTDLMMEDGSGLDLVKAVRANPSIKKLPVLMITSKAEVSHVIECANAGVNNYIVKPWQLDDLAKKIVSSQVRAK